MDLRPASEQPSGFAFRNVPSSNDEAAAVLQDEGHRVDGGVDRQGWPYFLEPPEALAGLPTWSLRKCS